MKMKIKSFWERLHTSFWFLPGLMALAAALLSWGSTQYDKQFHQAYLPEWLLYKGDL